MILLIDTGSVIDMVSQSTRFLLELVKMFLSIKGAQKRKMNAYLHVNKAVVKVQQPMIQVQCFHLGDSKNTGHTDTKEGILLYIPVNFRNHRLRGRFSVPRQRDIGTGIKLLRHFTGKRIPVAGFRVWVTEKRVRCCARFSRSTKEVCTKTKTRVEHTKDVLGAEIGLVTHLLTGVNVVPYSSILEVREQGFSTTIVTYPCSSTDTGSRSRRQFHAWRSACQFPIVRRRDRSCVPIISLLYTSVFQGTISHQLTKHRRS